MLIFRIRNMTHNCLENAKYARHEIFVVSLCGMIVFSPISMKRKTTKGKEGRFYCLLADVGWGKPIYNYSRPYFYRKLIL
jgi:hypothetical protein